MKIRLSVFASLLGLALVLWCWPSENAPASDAVLVRYWNGFTGPDGRTMLRMVKRFNRENPGAHVLMQRMDWSTYFNKLFVAGLGGRGPDLFVVHLSDMPRLMRARFLREVDDLVAGAEPLDAGDIDAKAWDAVVFDGAHMGVPLDYHPLGMYFNRRMLAAAGLVDASGNPSPPATLEEFLRAARAMTRDTDGDGRPDEWGFSVTSFRNNLYTLMAQFGGGFFNEDASRCILDSPENARALQFVVDLVHKHKIAPSPEDLGSWPGFRQGKVGIVFHGIYMLADLKRAGDLEYGGAPVPQLGAQAATWGDSHVLCLRSGLEGRRLESAWRLVKFLSDNSLDWAEGGQVPIRKSLRATPRFRSMTVQYEFSRQIPYLVYQPRVPFVFEFYSEFQLAVEKALRLRATPEEALRDAAAAVNEVIARDAKIYGRGGGGGTVR